MKKKLSPEAIAELERQLVISQKNLADTKGYSKYYEEFIKKYT